MCDVYIYISYIFTICFVTKVCKLMTSWSLYDFSSEASQRFALSESKASKGRQLGPSTLTEPRNGRLVQIIET